MSSKHVHERSAMAPANCHGGGGHHYRTAVAAGWIGPTKLVAAGQAALGCCTPYKSNMNIFGASSRFGVDGGGDQAGSCLDLTDGVQQQTS